MNPSPRHPEAQTSDRRHIVIAGAGPGGVCMAIKLKERGIDDFIILERERGIGGTWFNNRYPGLTCDVPSSVYSFSFEQKRDWSRTFAPQEEIRRYVENCAEKHGVLPHIRFSSEVTGAAWNDARAEWTLTLRDGTTLTSRIFISALGMFNQAAWPDIAGLQDFQGQLVHTSRWPENLDLQDRTVGIIGTAATATQLAPAIAPLVRQLDIYQRTPNWVLPKPDEAYSEAQLEAFRADSTEYSAKRQEMYDYFEQLITFDKPDLIGQLETAALENLANVADHETRRKLTPRMPIGAQRPLFSNDFYPMFNKSNVSLITTPIDCVTSSGIQCKDGTKRDLEILILATGYSANLFLSVIDVTGRAGCKLRQEWNDGARAYRGITVSGFPNLFMLYGPNTNNGSIMLMLEYQADYIVGKIEAMTQERRAWFEVKRDEMNRYNETLYQRLEKSIWSHRGSNYYRSASGRIVTQWPGTMAAYGAVLDESDHSAYEWG